MVQFKDNHVCSPNAERYLMRNYWKLSPASGTASKLVEEMKWLGYLYLWSKKSFSKQRAVYLHSRAQRGLISYEGLTKKELQSFCVERGLPIPGPATRDVNTLREILEQADEDATFRNFTTLPPELRVQILEYYMSSLSEPMNCGLPLTQPPTSQVCRLLRQECLPIFYGQNFIHFGVTPSYKSSKYRFSIQEDFLRTINKLDFAYLQRFEIGFRGPKSPTSTAAARYVLTVNVAKADCQLRIRESRDPNAVKLCATKEAMQLETNLVEEFQILMETIARREGPHKLRKVDLASLCRIIVSNVGGDRDSYYIHGGDVMVPSNLLC